MAEVEQTVVKGGICWMDICITKKHKGVEMSVKVDPRIEEAMASMCAGKAEPIESFCRDWVGLDPDHPLQVRRSYTLDNPKDYRLDHMGGAISISYRDEPVNISFLRFVGVGSPTGVTFLMTGPYSPDYPKQVGSSISGAVKQFVRDFIVPKSINFRLSSTEI